jgi:hypothetical protein
MGYYIRVLGRTSATSLWTNCEKPVIPVLHISEGNGDSWQQLTLSHNSGQEIAIIEKNPVVEGQLGAEELREFVDEVPHYTPESAATWLQRYLPTVKVIYAFQLLKGTDVSDGWSQLHRLYSACGITQEAFSKLMGKGVQRRGWLYDSVAVQ